MRAVSDTRVLVGHAPTVGRGDHCIAMSGAPTYGEAGLSGRRRMHELAIAESVVSTVLERTGGRQVSLVRLRIGRFSGVVPDALSFCFELATSGTPLEGAALEIEDVQGQARCRTCGVEFGLVDAFLLCDCGSADVQLLAGRELSVMSVEVA